MDFEIGKIVNTHGLKGELRIFPYTFDPTRFKLLKQVKLKMNEVVLDVLIEKVSFHKQFVICKFKNIDDIDNALKYKNYLITIKEEDALPLGDSEYYYRDLLDCEVFTTDGELLGPLTDVLETGANDVYVVKHNGKEILLPAIKSCIINVDIKNKKVLVSLPKGLID